MRFFRGKNLYTFIKIVKDKRKPENFGNYCPISGTILEKYSKNGTLKLD